MTAGRTLEITTPSDREIRLVRAFDAPRSLVFDCWTRPELVVRWLGADGWRLVVCDIDLRPGGAWRFLSEGPAGATMGHGGTYVEVDRPGRLAYTESYDDQWFAGEARVVHAFAEHAGVTTVTTTMRFASREVRDRVAASPMARGVGEGYARLDAVLADHISSTREGQG